jgi:hypothetical protein
VPRLADSRPASRGLLLSGTALGMCALMLVGCASSNRVTAACQPSVLVIRLVHTEAAGPIAGGYLSFTNGGNRRCTLSGWPSIQGIRTAGMSSPGRRVRTTQFGPNVSGIPRVVVAPGGHADAVFAGGTVPGPGRSTCGRPYRHLVVAAPGRVRTVVLSAWLPYLDAYLPACVGIDVSMVVAPGSLYHG